MPRPTQKPPSPIPRIPPKVAPKRATKTLPSHGLTAKNFPCRNEGRNKDRFAHHLKVANRSFSVAETSPARAGAQRSEREKGGDFVPEVQGRSPGTPLVTFVVKRKSPGVWGGAPKSGGVGAASPSQTPGAWGGAPKSGGAGAASPAQTLPGVPSMARPCSRGAPADAARVEKETAQSKTAPSLWCLCIGKLSD